MNLDQFYLSPEVEEALRLSRPVLAMESTIITHGLPYPENRNFLQQANDLVRSFDVVPATVAVVGGSVCVGLSKEQESALFQNGKLIKISLRDLGPALSQKTFGGTLSLPPFMPLTVSGFLSLQREELVAFIGVWNIPLMCHKIYLRYQGTQ